MDANDVSYDREKMMDRLDDAQQFLAKGEYDMAEKALTDVEQFVDL
jgi:hypothetical protein